jgi:uncharacterized protein YyaL (SSP411 family)
MDFARNKGEKHQSDLIILFIKKNQTFQHFLCLICNMNSQEFKYTNSLIGETSPYLLQHAHNPVNWHAWNSVSLEKAKKENRMILVSVGYSACHWCHVMEHESFEDEDVASLMNEHFICIKVDREERPDVDQVYMDAVQLVSGRGGWPLNCFALPDGRPFWGGTYFPKEQWKDILGNIVELFQSQREKLEHQAGEITHGIRQNDFIPPEIEDSGIDKNDIDEMVQMFTLNFDLKNGGLKGAPKFPMPNNFLFLLRYSALKKDHEILKHIELTLDKMASGGIYDQIGGGFTRYSTDERWHVPHFEKMLYDNAQLVSLYSEAYRMTNKEFYKHVVEECLVFVKSEMTAPEGGFHSALDADSEGEEGKFYVWNQDEVNKVCGKNSSLICEHFGIGNEALWEKGKNVLVIAVMPEQLAWNYNRPVSEVVDIIASLKTGLFGKRSERIHPGLDDKILTSWNALMLTGYIDAYQAIGTSEYLETAKKTANYILKNLRRPDGGLYRNLRKGKTAINGFLDDYAFVIEAFISLYQICFEEKWIWEAKKLMEYTIIHFYNPVSGMFCFTVNESKELVARKYEIMDGVIPASGSSIANSLFLLGHYFENPEYIDMARKMIASVMKKMTRYPTAFSNWGILALNLTWPFFSVAITGESAGLMADKLREFNLPGILVAGSGVESELPLLRHRFAKGRTLFWVCARNECLPPVETPEEVVDIILSG